MKQTKGARFPDPSRRQPSPPAPSVLACRRAFTPLLVLFSLSSSVYASEVEKEVEETAIREQVEARLTQLPNRDGAAIRVAVRDGRVVLQGHVRLLDQSLRAEQVVWKTPGVLDVDNELRVVPLGAGGDADIERQIRSIMKSDDSFTDTNLELKVVAGVVEIRGLFQDPADVLALKHRIASIPGVVELRIEAHLVALRVHPGDHGSA